MFFLNRKLIVNVFLIFFFFTGSMAIADIHIMDFLGENGVDKSNLALNKLSDQKFSHYLKNSTHYDILEHKTAIQNLLVLYRKDYSELEACTVGKSEKLRKDYSNNWIKEFKKKFGEEYVSKNYESIKTLLVNINMKHNTTFCIESERKILYSEIQYLLTVRDFCKSYIEFYNSMNESEKQFYNDRKKHAEEILKAASENPMQITLYGGRVGHYLSLQNRVDLSKEAFDFIINHPQFSKPFQIIKAINDLRVSVDK